MNLYARRIKTLEKKIRGKIRGKTLRVMVVTKDQPVSTLAQLLTIPEVRDIGERTWQEFERSFLDSDLYNKFRVKKVCFHFIGHLQSNKVRKVVEYFDMIQSVDSQELFEKIHATAKSMGKVQEVLLELNVSGDKKKYGLSCDSATDILSTSKNFAHAHIAGVMTILDASLSPSQKKKYFSQVSEFAKAHNLQIISMGMSDDYEYAVECGSTMIRIGHAIFDS
mgnify:FL=1